MKIYSSMKDIAFNSIKLQRKDYLLDDISYEIIKQLDKYKIKSQMENKYYLLASSSLRKKLLNPKASKTGRNYFFNIYKEWDEYGSIPLRLGNYIESLIKQDDILFGIYRIKDTVIDINNILNNKLLINIFNYGLVNDNKIINALDNNEYLFNKMIIFTNSILNAIIHLKTSYKGFQGGILIAIPSNIINNNDKHRRVYNVIDKKISIKSDYLLGYVSQNEGVCSYYPKRLFLKQLSKK